MMITRGRSNESQWGRRSPSASWVTLRGGEGSAQHHERARDTKLCKSESQPPSTTLLWVMTPSGILPRRNRDSSAARSPSFPGEISLLSFTDLLTTPRSFLSVKIPPIEICWSLADRYGWRMNGVNLDKSKQILDCWPHNGIPGGSGWSGLSQLCPSSIYKQLLPRFSNTLAVPSWRP